MSAIARRYAKAAVEAAQTDGLPAVEKLARDLEDVASAVESSAELREVLHNPALKSERAKVLTAVLQKLKVSDTAQRLVALLAERDRTGILSDVAREVQEEADTRAGRVRAYVTSAMALDDAHQQKLTKALEKRFQQQVALTVGVDTSLIGGLVCRVGDVTLDTSLKRQLERLREQVARA
jgi:F-type H+-transporting ATPase subunit delta